MHPLINYNSARELKAFLEERNLGMRKKFGQNFLINPAARAKLLDALALAEGDEVWEIGPGLGAMTAGLLEKGAKVTAFEIDPAFIGILREIFASRAFGPEAAFRLIEGDVMKTWKKTSGLISANDKTSMEELFLLGNLPYNVAAALLADFIENGRFFKRLVVTVQREVAMRMSAKPCTADYSSFSVLCSSVYKVTPLSIIKGASFYPAPRVDSQGVLMELLPEREEKGKFFYPLVRALFSSRRKIIKNTLSSFAASVIMKVDNKRGSKMTSAELTEYVLNRAGISGERRPETLAVHDFAVLSAILEEALSNG